MSRVTICSIPVDVLTMSETINRIDEAIIKRNHLHHVVVNAAKMVNAQKDFELKKSIVNCDIISADGQSVVWASKFLNKPLPERVTGIDLMDALVALSSKRSYKIYLLGAREEVVKSVVDVYTGRFGNNIIAGYRNGYFNKEEEVEIVKQISDSGADMLFVAMSSPAKEVFLEKYKELITVPFIMGVGGSFDVVAGIVKRAPKWMQKTGLEWLYRVWQEPGRMWKRYLFGNTEFIMMIIKEKMKQSFHHTFKHQ